MKIVIAGMGLIGGSFFKAAQRAGHDVTGFDRGDVADVAGAELVIVAVPPDVTAPWIAAHADAFASGAIVMDVCGVKGPVTAAVAALGPMRWTFVGGHPMAGREVSGFANAASDLFRGASMILTPFPGTDPAVLARLEAFFAEIGFGRTILTTPEHHDEMIAFTSQLCHVIASAYAQDPRVAEAIPYSAGSYANMTRIATMNPAAWTTLFLSDRAALLETLDGFLARLGTFRDALAIGDTAAIEAFIASGAAAKRAELAARAASEDR